MPQSERKLEKIWVVAGTGIKNGKYHTDPECRHLKQAGKVFEKDPEYGKHLEECGDCANAVSREYNDSNTIPEGIANGG